MNDRLEIYLGPGQEGYRLMVRPARADVISPAQAPEIMVPLSDLWC